MKDFRKAAKPCTSTVLQDFKIDQQGKEGVDAYQVDVSNIDGVMALEITMWDQGVFMITKEQAMKFFGLVEEPNLGECDG